MTYETLEILGDAILDYVVNSNLMKFTILDRYNVEERLSLEFDSHSEFSPFDAHQSKKMITRNNFLAQMMCLLGLDHFILLGGIQKRT
mmetsp:Transcript_6224/g.10133  ORF Transcript_6224/g.10133 Transcript_6224/m.10133 type:complete len:88 (-) Transcript_6224:718-981(-)